MTTESNSRFMRTIPLILIVVVWPIAHASAEPPTEWHGPVGWWSGDIGTTGGSAVQSGDTFEITGGGHDIGSTADGFHFMFKELSGDGSITARVVSNGTGSDTGAKGGVMIRDDISPGSAHAMTVVTGGAGGGATFQWRIRPDRISGSAHDPTPGVSPPYWVRIEKTRRYFSSYLSSDGRTWRQQGVTKTIAVNDPVYIGLCVTSHAAGSVRTYIFDNISYEGHVTDRPLNLVASQPLPADGIVCTNNWVILSWIPGELAALHNVYFGTDLDAVAQRKTSVLIATTDVPFASVGLPGFAFPNGLQMGTTYYWCVDEVNDAEPDSPWQGNIWSFRISAEPAVYLLITNEELAPAFQPLVDRRTMQGFPGRLLTVENIYATYLGADEPERIRNCIVNHYAQYGTQYVALGGDDVIVPVRYCFPYEPEGDPVPADIYYSDMDGDNWDTNGNGVYGERGDVGESELTPEVYLGRIPVRTAEQAASYINKVVTYETASPDDFANSLILFGGGQANLSGDARPAEYRHHDPISGKEVGLERYYLNLIQPHWQAVPFHLYCDTSTPWDMVTYGDYGLTVETLVDHLNLGPAGLGYHFVLYSGHAWYDHYAIDGGRRFRSGYASTLTNTIPSIYISGGCGPAAFDQEEPCLSEALLRNPDGGAVAFFGYVRSVGDGSHRDQIFQTVFRDRPSVLGEAIFNCKAALASRYVSKPYHHYIFNLQGDPLIHLMPDESGRHLQLFQPRGCEVIQQGSDLYIRWNAAGTGFEPDENVRLEWSDSIGKTWNPIPGAQALPYNAMLFIWEDCPLPAGFQYRVRVSSLSNPAIQDSSSRDFAIGNLRRLTVKSSPVKPLRIDGPYGNLTNYDVTVLPQTSVSLTAPLVPQEIPELEFKHWRDELGAILTDDLTYAFTCDGHATVVAQYGPSGLANNYYVNDDIPEDGIAAGDDQNDGRSPQRPMRHIQALLSRYPNLSWLDIVNVSPGIYFENISLTGGHSGLTLSGAGQDSCVIDGGARGSCIWLEDFASGIIRGFTIRNGAADVGGGIVCANSLLTIKDCTFADNDALGRGGGLYIGRGSSPEVSHCRFIGNKAKFGGGVYNLYCITKLTNCIFAANSADPGQGGALFNGESTVTVRNCTFSQNVARGTGGAIANYWDSTTTVSDSILWGDKRSEILLAGGTVAVTYSDIQGGWLGEGNIDADPLFVDPDNGDYHLKSQAGHWEPENRLRWVEDNATSPCIDAGNPDAMIGDEPEPNGGRINMGAYGGTTEASKSP